MSLLSQGTGLYPGRHDTAQLKASDWLGVLFDTDGEPVYTEIQQLQ